MPIRVRLVFWFVLVTVVSTGVVGVWLRSELRRDGEQRFDREVAAACESVRMEVIRQAESDKKLVAAACQSTGLVDRVITWMENGELANQRVALGTALVPNARAAFDQDELTLVTDKGDVLGADPIGILSRPRAELDAELHGGIGRFDLRTTPPVATVARCTRTREGRMVGLVAARHLVPLLQRLRATLKVTSVELGTLPKGEAPANLVRHQCEIADGSGRGIPIVVTKDKTELNATLAQLGQTVGLASVALTILALVLGVIIARGLGGPIAELAKEASKVASDQANPLPVRGTGEIAELAQAFNRMLEDLGSTRRRLAATTRVAAWREVARRVAHEVKNPLAPIRAAVETLRRLRAREDPAFDEYFDEATRTVLGEVHRISNIVTEFTRFARLAAPRPQELDVEEVVRHVVQLQKPAAGGCAIEQETAGAIPPVRADRDQIVQVLVNLLKNAVEACASTPNAKVVVTIAAPRSSVVDVTVADNGPGISASIAERLFEPYATTKAEGTGLGLAIAQRIAVEHGGELSLLSSERGGTGAVFRLRLSVSGPSPAIEAEAPVSDADA